MIDEALAERAAQAFFDATAGGNWPRPATEIQDDGEFVLLMVHVPRVWDRTEPSNEERRAIVNALNSVLPIPREEPLGCWMVVFLRDGNVYESILPNEF